MLSFFRMGIRATCFTHTNTHTHIWDVALAVHTIFHAHMHITCRLFNSLKKNGLFYRLDFIVGLTNSYGSNLYQNCSLKDFRLDWDSSVIDLTVPGEKTKSVWSSRTSQLVQKIANQNQCIVFGPFLIRDDVKLAQLVRARGCQSWGRRFDSGQKSKKKRTQIYMYLRYIDPQARVLNYCYK